MFTEGSQEQKIFDKLCCAIDSNGDVTKQDLKKAIGLFIKFSLANAASNTAGTSCDDRIYTNVCNLDDLIMSLDAGPVMTGCVKDVDGNVTGSVITVLDGESVSRLVLVNTDGTVVDPYTGAW